MIDLNKMEKQANKKVAQHINRMVDQAKKDTVNDFAEARKRLGITDAMNDKARTDLEIK